LLILVACALGCSSSEEGNVEASHLNGPVMKPKGKANEEKARGMTEETTRGMGEKKLGHER
jgi:hypothetical protein